MKEIIEYGLDAHLAIILENKFRECDWDWIVFARWAKNVDFQRREL